MNLFQATAAALAVAAAIIAMPSPAVARSYPCWMVRWYVNSHRPDEVEAMARQHKATPKERAEAKACLKEKK